MKKHVNIILFFFFSFFSAACLANGYSGTLPVMFINTENGKEIKDKVNYINATYYVDPMDADWCSALGSKDTPLHLQIRGRGNYTWASFDKKPYRIKLAEKQSLLGMSKSRHFALLAHADDNVAFLRNTVGFEVSRRIGMPFTPAQRPLEVVLNGDYIGLYFLTETVRVAKNRVNIIEQSNGQEDEDSITGGWLLEIDNTTQKEQQIHFPVDDTDLWRLKITYHSPDSLSLVQTDYLIDQIESIKRAIYHPEGDSTALGQIIDLNSLAKFYIVQEVVDHLEGFVGSCYFYKNLGEKQWKFGPVWDLGNAFNDYHSKEKFIYQDSPFPIGIIHTISRFPQFQEEVAKVWHDFYPQGLEGIDVFINTFLEEIAAAAVCDVQRWPAYGNSDIWGASRQVFDSLEKKTKWLDSQWRSQYTEGITELLTDVPETALFDIFGRRMNSHQLIRGLVIKKNSQGKRFSLFLNQ